MMLDAVDIHPAFALAFVGIVLYYLRFCYSKKES